MNASWKAGEMRRIKGVICDLDGTVVDSEPLHLEAWNLLLERDGYAPRDEWNKAFIGLPEEDTCAAIKKAFPGMNRYDDLLEMKQSKYRELITARGRKLSYPGVEQGLSSLAEHGFKLAVGTNSGIKNTSTALEAAGLSRCFAAVVTRDMVRTGKPAPEIYLAAAGLLGLEPAECVVVEDSPAGIVSGKAAGCLVAGVANSWPIDGIPGADLYFPDTASALDWVLTDGKGMRDGGCV